MNFIVYFWFFILTAVLIILFYQLCIIHSDVSSISTFEHTVGGRSGFSLSVFILVFNNRHLLAYTNLVGEAQTLQWAKLDVVDYKLRVWSGADVD